ncbi:MAG: hypothetical protein ACRDQ7_23630 [Haloechinothrix sp.]
MEWITMDSTITCAHAGTIRNVPSQDWVRVAQPGDSSDAPLVLVDSDPEGRSIGGCPNSGPNIKRCGRTLKVDKGYSEWIRIAGKAIVLSHLDGLTDGTLPGTVHYHVANAAQHFLRADR